jgi:hypothetical protein
VLLHVPAALYPRAGAWKPTLEEAEGKRSMAAVADRVVLAVDSSKLGARAIAVRPDWERIDLPSPNSSRTTTGSRPAGIWPSCSDRNR